MKFLIAIESCHQHRPQNDVQRRTWVKDIEGADYKFFLGKGESPESKDDEIILPNVGDDYKSLPAKTREIMKYAGYKEYDFVCKVDSDVQLFPKKLLASGFEQRDYTGRVNGTVVHKGHNYCSGFTYILSAKAAKIVANAQLMPDESYEDRWVGIVLGEAGIKPHYDGRYKLLQSVGPEDRRGKTNVVAIAEYPYKTLPAGSMPLMEVDYTGKMPIMGCQCIGCRKKWEKLNA